MPLSKTEHRILHDSIYVDLLDMKEKIKELISNGGTNHEILNIVNNATRSIPAKAVRLIGKNN